MTRWIPILATLAVLVAGCGGGGKGTGPKDTTPPAQVADLKGSLTNDSTITLTWTAPGDDASSGSADRYDLRWSTGFLTDGTWQSAHQCVALPEPREAGSGETHPVTGLPRSTPVRLALKAMDEADNASAISNVVTVHLPPAAPTCSLSVEGLSFGSIAPHETADRSFTITNIGGGRLVGEVGIMGDRFSLTEGGGSFSLGYRDSRAVNIRFTPGISGPAQGSVTLGTSGCGPLPCSGQGSGSYCIMDWDTVRFGNVNVGEHREWRITLTNRGDNWTAVTPQLEGCTGMRVPYDQSFTLQPGQSRSLGVEFWPQVDGPVDCRLKLNAQGECDEVVLLGTGIGPQCRLSADGRGFGPVPVGTVIDWPFTIENRGGGEVQGTVSAPASPDFMILSGAGPYTLLAGQIRTVRIRFAPQSGGEKSWVVETGTDACLDVQIWGTGLAGECAIAPDTLNLGAVAVGASAEGSFEIRNVGVGPLSGIVSETCEDFAVVDGGGSYSLDTGQTRTVRVRWTPRSSGVAQCAVATGASCGSVIAHGTATGSLCAVAPVLLDFGTIPAWSEAEQTFVITNAGVGAWLDGSVTESCPRFSVVRGGGNFQLGQGQSREIVVRFNPDLSGPYECVIDIGTDLCPAVQATGYAVGAVCEIIPPSVVFPPIRPRADVDTTIVIRNIGGGMIVAQPSLSCSDYAIVSGGEVIQLAHGESHALRVRWSPDAEGPSTCSLQIGSTCDSVSLSGTCVDVPPVCAVSLDTLQYGLATVDRSGQTLWFWVRNDGGRVLSGTVASTSPEFIVTEGAGDFRIRAWEQHRVAVQFRPSAVGARVGMVTLGSTEYPTVACAGTGISYRIEADMYRVDDIGRLSVNGTVTYTARFGKRGTDQTGYVYIGHTVGESGLLDITPHCVPGTNRLRLTLENTGCCDASLHVVVQRTGAVFVDEDFTGNGHDGGVLFDLSPTFEAAVE